MAHLHGKDFMAYLSGSFYAHLPFKNIWFNEYNIYKRWTKILGQDPQLIEIVTWNDFTETTNFWDPVPGVSKAIDIQPFANNVNGRSHAAFMEISRIFIQQWKLGTTPVEAAGGRESLHVWYRTHPVDASATQDPIGRPAFSTFGKVDPARDVIYILALASKANGTVTLSVGASAQVSRQISVRGWNYFEISELFPAGLGPFQVQLVRDGKTIVNVPGLIPIDARPTVYDFNYHAPFGTESGGKGDTGDSCPILAGSDRKDCGTITTTPQQCRDKGCCWDVLAFGIAGPNCYYKPNDSNVPTSAPSKTTTKKTGTIPTPNPSKTTTQKTNSPTLTLAKTTTSKKSTPTPAKPKLQCPTSPESIGNRVDCGSVFTTPQQCSNLGCCWSLVPSGMKGPNCYFNPRSVIPPKCPVLAASQRMDCGTVTTTPQQCVSKGCCWSVLAPGTLGPNCYSYPSLQQFAADQNVPILANGIIGSSAIQYNAFLPVLILMLFIIMRE